MMPTKTADLKEPLTGITLPGRMKFYGLSMLNLGCGASSQKSGIGGKTIHYVLGIYVENNERARESIRPWIHSTPSSGFTDVIMASDPSAFFAKAAHLVRSALSGHFSRFNPRPIILFWALLFLGYCSAVFSQPDSWRHT